jgi:dihydroorotase
MVFRDIELARLTGCRLHLLHLSTARSVELVRAAKADGLPVTAEACPHHFTLTDACCASFDPVFKVNPPLRAEADLAAIKAGLADGTIDVIATDHAPHPTEAKERPFEEAPSGMLGLETALALVWDELVLPGVLTPTQAFAACSWNGAAIAGLEHQGRPIAPDAVANLCVFDPGHRWEVEPERLASKARNTPYGGRSLTGKVRHTILRGEVVVRDGEAQR